MNGHGGKPKRKRIATMAQRRAANIRERRRMFNLNEAFDLLRKKVPTFAYEKRLSRIETLRLAITYISFMAQLVDGKSPKETTLDSTAIDTVIPVGNSERSAAQDEELSSERNTSSGSSDMDDSDYPCMSPDSSSQM